GGAPEGRDAHIGDSTVGARPRRSRASRLPGGELPDGGDELIELERLADECVDALLSRRVDLRGAAEQADASLGPLAAQEGKQLEPVAVADVEVEQDDVDVLVRQQLAGPVELPGLEHPV